MVTKGTAKVAVQCKRQAQPVGVAALQQVVAGAASATARPRWW
ncbi:restriction endonuclease [Mycobacterium sp.]